MDKYRIYPVSPDKGGVFLNVDLFDKHLDLLNELGLVEGEHYHKSRLSARDVESCIGILLGLKESAQQMFEDKVDAYSQQCCDRKELDEVISALDKVKRGIGFMQYLRDLFGVLFGKLDGTHRE